MSQFILKRLMSSSSNAIATKNVVVVGGSWAGFTLGRNLCEAPHINVTVIEKAPYHAHNFIFPRFSVYGHNQEALAFIPLEKRRLGIPNMIFEECIDSTDEHVILKSGLKVPYDILVIATGVERTIPASLGAVDAAQGVAKLRQIQDKIRAAKDIAVIGAGAVGVELATDIKYIYKDSKNVTLYNSRDKVLPRFHESVHILAEPEIRKLGVNLVNNTRPIVKDETTIQIQGDQHDDRLVEKSYDLVFNCTGQKSTSSPFKNILGDAILSSGSIKVNPTLQVPGKDNIFAIGDVSDIGPQMAKAARAQADLTTTNILNHSLGNAVAEYVPVPSEAGLHLTLGFSRSLYNTGDQTQVESHPEDYILKTAKAWDRFGVDDKFKPKL